MFKRLKSLFLKKEEDIEETVTIEGLSQWIAGKKRKGFESSLSKIRQKRQAIVEIIKSTKNDISLLEAAELKNKKIPKREMQLMHGNRDSYIKKTRDFLKNLDTDLDDLDAAEDFLKRFSQQLDLLNKSNNKSYYVLQEFFANETSKIARGIKSLEEKTAELREILSGSGMDRIGRINEIIDKINSRLSYKEELSRQHESQKKALEQKRSQMQRMKGQIEELKKSREYLDFENLKKEREAVISDIRKEEDTLSRMFSSLETGLKKYERMTLDMKTVNSYLKGPAYALLDDNGLLILKILENLKKNIKDGTISMKDRKKEKTFEMIDRLSSDFLDDFRTRLLKLRDTKRTKDEKMAKNKVMHDYNEFDYNLSHLKQKVEAAEDDLKRTERAFEKTEIASLEKELKSQVREAFGIRLTIAS